ncbi:hypothetical protein KI387_031550 [Taxus chinensis]|uniref:Elongation factor-like 1 n=1 Tax=Taxus chinensis TaxID=29808 RepID=A0AA38C0G5_TAXCH|nr:hypothetical protein KI387_031550 [Taxus chinensis]
MEVEVAKLRNMCIVAHVDHGKTTVADHLIARASAHVGQVLVSERQAGKVRFMDYLDEERLRAITMKSSSVALRYNSHLFNLIDSPGHIDFSGEVSTAARLSDGALVVVDSVEGVHIQTHAVLRQAWLERLTPCLLLNKIDRLITQLKLTPMEAHARLQNIVREVNNIISAYRSEKYLSDVDSILAKTGEPSGIDTDFDSQEEDAFQPHKGNVAFICALDGWGFCIRHFADLYASKLGASSAALNKALWGDHYYIPKTKKIVGKKAAGHKAKPMFVQFVLEPLWQVYESIFQGNEGQEMLHRIIKSMNLTIPSRDLQHKDPKVVLQALMSRWLPLSDTILSMAIDCLPDPLSAQSHRFSRLLPKHEVFPCADHTMLVELDRVRRAVETCDSSSSAPCIAFVSKMFAVPLNLIPRQGPHGELLDNLVEELGLGDIIDAGHQDCFLAFARVFSGVISTGQKIYVLSSLYDPLRLESQQKHMQEAKVQALYMMMGRGLEPVAAASAGNIVAIRGLEQHILKSATITSTPCCWPFASMTYQAGPILRVAIEPSKPSDMAALTKGLQLLSRADPFVEVSVSGRGENVLAAAGEVHLERCIKDLKNRFARVGLEVSPPIVSYRETIESDAIHSVDNSKNGSLSIDFVEKTTPNGRCTVRVQVMKLPSTLTKVLDESADLFQDILEGNAEYEKTGISSKETILGKQTVVEESEATEDPVLILRKRMIDAVETEMDVGSQELEKKRSEEDRNTWLSLLHRIWALGPRRIGPNILLSPNLPTLGGNTKVLGAVSDSDTLGMEPVLVRGSAHISEKLGLVEVSCENLNGEPSVSKASVCAFDSLYMEAQSLQSSVSSGFQLATAAGPLCDEPMWGLAFLVEAYMSPGRSMSSNYSNLFVENVKNDVQLPEQYGPFSGQVMTAVKESCRTAMLLKKPRLVEAMYFCEVSTPTEYLGSMYAVLARRRARILKEEMREGSALFTVHAYVPVAESFGFADELRRWTSGAASPQLLLSHWEALPHDPFFVPKTEEELEEFGDGSSVPPNTARKMIDSVRRRKGLPVEEKVVQHATKQRTLARKV